MQRMIWLALLVVGCTSEKPASGPNPELTLSPPTPNLATTSDASASVAQPTAPASTDCRSDLAVADAARAQGKLVEAATAYQQATSCEPVRVAAYLGAAATALARGDFDALDSLLGVAYSYEPKGAEVARFWELSAQTYEARANGADGTSDPDEIASLRERAALAAAMADATGQSSEAAGRPRCAAIVDQPTEGAVLVRGWRGVLAYMLKHDQLSDGSGSIPAAADKARAAACGAACDGKGPWTVTRNVMHFAGDTYVVAERPFGQYLMLYGGVLGGTAYAATYLSKVEIVGELLHVATSQSSAVDLGGDEPDLRGGPAFVFDDYYDARTGRALREVRRFAAGAAGVQLTLDTQRRELRLEGAGCDLRIALDRPTAQPQKAPH